MMTLSEELTWRGFVNQTTLESPNLLDKRKYTFYLGVDPSADSMTIGHLAMAMMVKHFIKHGHKGVLLVGGATGMIGDPDGKAEERKLQTLEDVERNKKAIAKQYETLFEGMPIQIVDNYDWFKDYKFLEFLRDVGKHVPMRQMLGREFVQSRLGEEGNGISYAEFSYVLIQAYDFLHLHKTYGVDMQVCGSDQWGNSIAGVDLIRRLSGDSTEVWTGPLVIDPQTGRKFGKTEAGAIWLDPKKTSPTSFYQFWVNCDDAAVEYYLKLYTELTKEDILSVMIEHLKNPQDRSAQFKLADEVTSLVHGEQAAVLARSITSFLTGKRSVSEANEQEVAELKREIPSSSLNSLSVIDSLVKSGLAKSNTVARQLIASGAIYVNNERHSNEFYKDSDFNNGRLLLRRGKAYKDSALIERL